MYHCLVSQLQSPDEGLVGFSNSGFVFCPHIYGCCAGFGFWDMGLATMALGFLSISFSCYFNYDFFKIYKLNFFEILINAYKYESISKSSFFLSKYID